LTVGGKAIQGDERAEAGLGEAGRTQHVRGLDGIRGLAVAAVVAYHLGFGWARGGYLGVDTLLVLSGYLITAGLLSEHTRCGRVRLRAFWARRARRLIPALLVLLAALAVYATTIALPDEARSLRLDSAGALGFVSNWRFILTSQGYFGQTAAPSLLRHTWSLGVEAQLYLLWPLAVVAVVRRRGRRGLLIVASALAAMSAGLAIALAARSADTSRAYYGTDTRAGAFLLGAAVAAFFACRVGQPTPAHRRRPSSGSIAIVGLALTLALWATLSGTSPWLFRGGLALAATASAAMIVAIVASPVGLASRVFSVSPLRLLGRVSYGIYLWHWPLVLVLDQRRTGLSGAPLLAVRLTAIAAMTTASWVLIERPVLHGRSRPAQLRWRPALAAGVSVGMVAMVLMPSEGVVSGASPRPVTTSRPTVQALMLGDSVAVTLAGALQPFGPAYRVNLVDGGIVGCGVALGSAVRSLGHVSPILRQCVAWQADWKRRIEVFHPAVTLVLLGRWEMLDRVINGQWRHIGQPAYDVYLAGLLDQAIATAQRDGATVVMCTAPYYQGVEPPEGGIWPENDPARVDRFNQLVRQAVARHPAVVLFDLHALVSPHGHFRSVIGGLAIRTSDGVHFGPAAGSYLAPRLLPVIAASADGGTGDNAPSAASPRR
jgi:peptidoglycan/LPS O-acetylase OafA/YrhL